MTFNHPFSTFWFTFIKPITHGHSMVRLKKDIQVRIDPMKPIIPFEPKMTNEIPNGDQWIAQVKWDGTRILTYYEKENLRMFNRKGNERTIQYPELHQLPSLIKGNSFILDGEVIAFQDGVPSFYDVMRRDRRKNTVTINHLQTEIPITYMIFDLLYFNGKWLIETPLYRRQEMLMEIIQPTNEIQIVQSFRDCQSLYDAVIEQGLEGIVCKDLYSAYLLGGKDERWLKKKKEQDLIAVVGGVTYNGALIRSIDLGIYNEKGELVYIGSAGSSKLTLKDWREVTEVTNQILQGESPFHNYSGLLKNHEWLSPILKVKVTFLEWTKDHTMRQPVIQSFVF